MFYLLLYVILIRITAIIIKHPGEKIVEYKNIIQTTIEEVYPNYLVKVLLKKLEEKNIISYKED